MVQFPLCSAGELETQKGEMALPRKVTASNGILPFPVLLFFLLFLKGGSALIGEGKREFPFSSFNFLFGNNYKLKKVKKMLQNICVPLPST